MITYVGSALMHRTTPVDLSAELALRSQYQCCFHNIIKSANYSATVYMTTVLILFTHDCVYKCEQFSGSVHGE